MNRLVIQLLFLLLCISCASNKKFSAIYNVGEFQSNYDSLDFQGNSNKPLLKFSKNKDFVLATSYSGFWGGYVKKYNVLALNKNSASCYKYNGDLRYGKKFLFITFWKRDSIKNGKFNLIKKDIPHKNVNELLTFLTEVDFWNMSQDSISQDIEEKRNYVADASTYVIDIIKGGNKKSLSDPPNLISNNIQNKKLKKIKLYINDWWYKNCN